MTTAAILVSAVIAIVGYGIGVLIGIWIGQSANWLRPTVQRQARQLDTAWQRIEALEHGEDDWADLGIGRRS